MLLLGLLKRKMCKVSVIMPLYNGEKHVGKAVKSILNQTFTDFELIIVNDGCTDSSREIVSRFKDSRIKLYDNDINRGISYTRNKAISLSSGEYIAIMDDDDIAPPYRLEKEVEYLDKHLNVVAVIGNACRIDKDDNDLNELWKVCKSPYRTRAVFFFGDPVPNSSAMVRKSVVIDNNIYFRDNMYGIEDYDFWSRISVKGLIGSINEIMLYFRMGHGSESSVQNTEEARIKRSVEYYKIKEQLFRDYNINLDKKQMDIFNVCFSEGKTVSNFDELVAVFPVIRKIIRDTKGKEIGYSIKWICYIFYIKMCVKSLIVKITGKNKMWWDYNRRRNVKPRGLE